LRAPDLGIFAEIADQDHLVHATGHDALLLVARIVRGTLIPSPGPRRRFVLRHHAFPQRRRRDRLGAMFSVCSSINARPMQPPRRAFLPVTLTFVAVIGRRAVAAREI
jgi:hypothetical protein